VAPACTWYKHTHMPTHMHTHTHTLFKASFQVNEVSQLTSSLYYASQLFWRKTFGMNGAVFYRPNILPVSHLTSSNSIKALETTQTTENIAHLPHSFFIHHLTTDGMDVKLPVCSLSNASIHSLMSESTGTYEWNNSNMLISSHYCFCSCLFLIQVNVVISHTKQL